jgi:hypothetical protein
VISLQLRGSNGTVLATESIAIVNTYYLLSLARTDLDDEAVVDAEEGAEIEALLEAWSVDREPVNLQLPSDEESEFPRYQIQVRLVDHDAVP